MKPSAEELAKWEAILVAEGLSMMAGHTARITYACDLPLGNNLKSNRMHGEENRNVIDLHQRPFDYTTDRASAGHGKGRGASQKTERGRKLASQTMTELWRDEHSAMAAGQKKASAKLRELWKTDPEWQVERRLNMKKMDEARLRLREKTCKRCGSKYMGTAKSNFCTTACKARYFQEPRSVGFRVFHQKTAPQVFPPPVYCHPGSGQIWPVWAGA